jgi:quercetin dioxygenase-like cupin family protein
MDFLPASATTSRRANPHHFTDGVWQAEVLPVAQPGGMRAARFVYAPGAHSHWHVHDGEHALVALDGRGLVGRWGEPRPTPVAPGDWVRVLPGEKHWHGATPDEMFVHLAITATGETIWHEHVTDEEYRGEAPH